MKWQYFNRKISKKLLILYFWYHFSPFLFLFILAPTPLTFVTFPSHLNYSTHPNYLRQQSSRSGEQGLKEVFYEPNFWDVKEEPNRGKTWENTIPFFETSKHGRKQEYPSQVTKLNRIRDTNNFWNYNHISVTLFYDANFSFFKLLQNEFSKFESKLKMHFEHLWTIDFKRNSNYSG